METLGFLRFYLIRMDFLNGPEMLNVSVVNASGIVPALNILGEKNCTPTRKNGKKCGTVKSANILARNKFRIRFYSFFYQLF